MTRLPYVCTLRVLPPWLVQALGHVFTSPVNSVPSLSRSFGASCGAFCRHCSFVTPMAFVHLLCCVYACHLGCCVSQGEREEGRGEAGAGRSHMRAACETHGTLYPHPHPRSPGRLRSRRAARCVFLGHCCLPSTRGTGECRHRGRKGQWAARSPAAQGKLRPHSECFPAFNRVVCGECGTAVAARPSLSSTWRLFAMTGLGRKAYNSQCCCS